MEKTIKKDLERIILKEELLDDNSLLQYVVHGMNIQVCIRYIEEYGRRIQEHVLAEIPVAEYADNIGKMIQINEEKNTIAIFRKNEKNYVLDTVYDIVEHSFVASDFTECAYQKTFLHPKK